MSKLIAWTGSGLIGLLSLAVLRLALLARDHRRRLAAKDRELLAAASRDPVTGLANRAQLCRHLDGWDGGAGRWSRGFGALLLVDLDGLRAINDRFGIVAGDQLLVAVAQRLQSMVGARDRVSRLGGDEFAILCDGGADEAAAVAIGVHEQMAAPFRLTGDLVVTLHASVALSLAADAASGQDLLRNADIAMSMAKSRGGGCTQVFRPDMYQAVRSRSELRDALETALQEHQFTLWYQPIVSLDSGSVHRLEALVRWRHPRRGLIPPAEFVPLAEETGFIVRLGAWVLREACRAASQWRQHAPGVGVAVNVSAAQLATDGFVTQVTDTLRDHDLDAGALTLEVTESGLMTDPGASARQLGSLRRLGVGVAVDDFGTGHSSLSRLRELPMTELKIDRSFVHCAAEPRQGTTLLTAILALCASLQLEVVAEGIETPAQLQILLQQGCAHGQGFLFARPSPIEELEPLLDEQGRRPTAVPGPAAAPAATPAAQGADDTEALAALVDRAMRPAAGIQLARSILGRLQRVSGLDAVYLTGIDWATRTQEVRYASSAGALEVAEGLRVAWDESLCQRALAEGRTIVHDVAAVFPEREVAVSLGFRAFVTVPVRGPDGQLLGTLCGASIADDAPPPSTVALMELFARLLADLDAASGEAGPGEAGPGEAGPGDGAGTDVRVTRTSPTSPAKGPG